jgi:hypothetical protein
MTATSPTLPDRHRSSPFAGLDLRTATGQRIRDLAISLMARSCRPVNDTATISDAVAAAELMLAAEKTRREGPSRSGGEGSLGWPSSHQPASPEASPPSCGQWLRGKVSQPPDPAHRPAALSSPPTPRRRWIKRKRGRPRHCFSASSVDGTVRYPAHGKGVRQRCARPAPDELTVSCDAIRRDAGAVADNGAERKAASSFRPLRHGEPLIADALQQDPELVVTTTRGCAFRGIWMIRCRKEA